jgi:hypothetical protein
MCSVFFYKRLSQDGSALSDSEETTLDALKKLICDEDIVKIEGLEPEEGLEVESDSGNRYYVYRR